MFQAGYKVIYKGRECEVMWQCFNLCKIKFIDGGSRLVIARKLKALEEFKNVK